MIKIQCSCGKRFKLADKHAGRQGRCPNCGTIIVVPKATSDIPTFSEEEAVPRRYDAQELFEKVIDTVVGISDDGRLYGSGVLLDDKGLIVTNRHVVGLSEKVKVQLNDGSNHIGELLRSYQDVDLAFLKIPVRDIPYASLAENGNLKIGQSVSAIGHPMGLQNTITRGIISALNRIVDGVGYIQTDASINPGNSGGPLFSEYAEIVGINTMGLTATQGLGFSIPAEIVRERFEEVKANQKRLFTMEYCGVCGKNSSTLRYCNHCGVELDSHQPMISERLLQQREANFVDVKLVHCGVCNGAVKVGDTYCPKCGTQMVK